MTQCQNFEDDARRVSVLIDKRQFRKAFKKAHQLTSAFPEQARAWFLQGLAAELSGRRDEAQRSQDYAKQCPDYTRVLEGDFYRDFAIGDIRSRQLETAEKWLLSARRLHLGETNRLACLLGVEGRFRYTRKEYGEATLLHAQAHQRMQDPQWIYNNLLPWLKAVVARGPHDSEVGEVGRICQLLIDGLEEYGTSQHTRRMSLITSGKFGNKLDDFLQRGLNSARRIFHF